MTSFIRSRPGRFALIGWSLLGAVVCVIGCLRHSFPVQFAEVIRLDGRGPAAGALSTREWVEDAHIRLQAMLPTTDKAPLLTDDLTTVRGRPRDVARYFEINRAMQHSLLANSSGLVHTAQATVDVPKAQQDEPWPGFEDIWAPIEPGFALSGRIGYARRGDRIINADCIIMLPGILADKNVSRTRDVCLALRDAGYHVIAIDLRGHGRTLQRYPNHYPTFGILETGDLIALSEWLEDQPHVRETGMMGFCWGANLAMLAAWEDGRGDDDRDVSDRVAKRMRPRSDRPHFRAGILAFSPPVRFERIIEQTGAREWTFLDNPVLAGLQDRIRLRMKQMGYERPCGSLERLMHEEAERTPWGTTDVVSDGLDYLRLMPHAGARVSNKLEHVRTPLLIVHAANDPLCPAQDVADFISTVQNPHVAAIVLAGGGHDGFAPYASNYFYSMVFNFYDPGLGAAANLARRVAPVALAPQTDR
ncbi:MAG: alpha/beta fold hydrolase [Phycisphaerales bacterium]|nr:alpha/beta fold hydrolase [Phycisphaerales bacterium]